MIIKVFADTVSLNRQCRSCEGDISWAEVVKSGKRMPFDGELVPNGSSRQESTARVILHIDTDINASHHSTCPDADKWRNTK